MYWRLSGFYFFYFAALGALMPYLGLYLRSLGFAANEIGELVAIIMATKIVAPNILGWIADHTRRRMVIVRLASLFAMLAFGGVFLGTAFWWLAVVLAFFGFFWNASLPQFEANTMNHLGADTQRYSSIRLWGSIGFILSVTLLGHFLGHKGMALLPLVLVILLSGILLSSLAVPEHANGSLPADHEPLRNVLRRPVVLALLSVCFLMQASHGPYYTFYSIYLEDYGYAPPLIGQLWALGVVAEIVIFLIMHRMLTRFGVRNLLLASLILATMRWLLIGWYVDHLSILIIAQLMHAASFGVFHAIAISLIHKFFTGKHQMRGQALYSSLSFGAGGVVGSLYSGYTWSTMGPPLTFTLAAFASILALLVVWRMMGECN